MHNQGDTRQEGGYTWEWQKSDFGGLMGPHWKVRGGRNVVRIFPGSWRVTVFDDESHFFNNEPDAFKAAADFAKAEPLPD